MVTVITAYSTILLRAGITAHARQMYIVWQKCLVKSLISVSPKVYHLQENMAAYWTTVLLAVC